MINTTARKASILFGGFRIVIYCQSLTVVDGAEPETNEFRRFKSD